jgi:dTDP-glucose pyrophosphorylase
VDVLNKIKDRIINADQTVLQGLQQMDKLMAKLLFVFEAEKFLGLLSIGDLQRAIIKNKSLDTKVKEVMRDDITVSYADENKETIRKRMLDRRTECMPVLDRKGNLIDVYFWEEEFSPGQKRVDTKLNIPVVIMAGGKGTRLKPLTNIIPKPLIPIGEKPIIEVIIEKFCDFGICDFYISVNYKQELIRFYFDNLENKPYNLTYIEEKNFSGTAGSLSLLKDKIGKTFFVSNCDILVEDNYGEIYNYHLENKNDITIVASLKHFKIPYGTIETGKDGELISIQEKPELTFKINTGLYVLNADVLKQIPEGRSYDIPDLVIDLKKNGHKVGVFPISEGSWFDMGEWPEYQKVINAYMAKGI